MPWEPAIQQLADVTGFTPDNLRYTLSLLVAIPVGFLFRASTRDPYVLKGAEKEAAIRARHVMCAVIGFMFMTFCFGYEILHSIFSSLVTFILMRTVPTKHVHIVISLWAMGYMSCSHLYRQIVAYGESNQLSDTHCHVLAYTCDMQVSPIFLLYPAAFPKAHMVFHVCSEGLEVKLRCTPAGSWTIDFTTPQLLLTQKFMNIAFALHDSSRKPGSLSEEQAKRVISKALPFTEYLGYIFCMHTLLAGPSCDYK
jgi:hypothetical protein